MSKKFLLTLATVVIIPQSALAKDDDKAPPPALYSQLMDCRTIADPTARLACYDAKTAALDEATRKNEVVITDKEAVKRARRGLFGFTAPIGKLMGFGGDDEDENRIDEIESTIESARRTPGGWHIKLADGSVWEQNDTRSFILSPKPGNAVKVKRGSLGTFRVSVAGQPSVKMRRVE
ncbi:hypothetical protein [Novosphingobium naphthalenivorans]|uniref:hypothetical protein n=1 Tax=Novosphingobium naphthalenivorans TaxID=273168 RepID=UPI000835E98A|nr:hypothetical protein [Novosphingobium naphthalenivorans]